MRSGARAGGRPSGRRSRALLILFLMLIVGLPLAILGSLLGSRGSLPATSGEQPGGTIEGRLVDEQEAPLRGLPVRLFLISDEGEVALDHEVTTAADGAFSLVAPPHRGKYEIRVGGGEWVHSRRELSFLDRNGTPIELPPLELGLEPGCTLRVDLERTSDRYADSGRYELHGRLSQGLTLGLVRPALRLSGEFESGRIEIGGLPPLEGKLAIFLDNGDAVELPLELEPGAELRELRL